MGKQDPLESPLDLSTSLDDVARCALQARAKRGLHLVVGLLLLLLVVVFRDVYRVSHSQPLGFAFHMPSSWDLYLPGFGLTILLGMVLLAPMLGLGRSPHMVVKPNDVEFEMDDIFGSMRLKETLSDLVSEYRNFASLETKFGGKPPRAVLFEGPPGTGKTMAAKVLAREAGVPFLFVSASSFQSMYYGQTNRKLRAYFRHLRKLTRNYGGAIGFIEEFDAIGASRAGLGGTSSREGVAGVVGELLVQLQSFEKPSGRWKNFSPLGQITKKNDQTRIQPRFLLLAATNRASDLDPALIRPGRFDRIIGFELPTKAARVDLLRGLLSRRDIESSLLSSPGVLDLVGSMTSGMSQAGLNRIVEEAGAIAWKRDHGPLSNDDLIQALSGSSLGVSEGVPYDTPQRLRIAVHEAGHGCFTWLVGSKTKVGLISIHKRRSALGLTAFYQGDDSYVYLREELQDSIAGLLAGMAAEKVFLGDCSTGSSNDLAEATNRAFQMVTVYGMGDTLVSSVGGDNTSQTNALLFGDGLVRSEVREILSDAHAKAVEIITGSSEKVWKVVLKLVEEEEIGEAQLREVLGPPREYSSSPQDNLLISEFEDVVPRS